MAETFREAIGSSPGWWENQTTKQKELPPAEVSPANEVSIEDTQKEAFVPDFNLHDPIPTDLAGIQAGVQAAMTEVARIQETLKGFQVEPTTKPTEPTTFIDKALGRVPEPKIPTMEESMAERAELERKFLEGKGITPEQFKEAEGIATEMAALNGQLLQLQAEKQQQLLNSEQRMQGGLKSALMGEQAFIERQYAVKEMGVAAQLAAKSMMYNAVQGRIDKAQADFDKALDYTTYKERQAVEDYRWALGFYMDIDKESKRMLQQEFENNLKEYDRAYREQQDKLSLQLQREGLLLDWTREKRLRGELVTEEEAPFAEPSQTWIDYFGPFAGVNTRNQLEWGYIEKYNEGKAVALQLKSVDDLNRRFPEIKASLDMLYTQGYTPPQKVGVMETIKHLPGGIADTFKGVKNWWSNLWK